MARWSPIGHKGITSSVLYYCTCNHHYILRSLIALCQQGCLIVYQVYYSFTEKSHYTYTQVPSSNVGVDDKSLITPPLTSRSLPPYLGGVARSASPSTYTTVPLPVKANKVLASLALNKVRGKLKPCAPRANCQKFGGNHEAVKVQDSISIKQLLLEESRPTFCAFLGPCKTMIQISALLLATIKEFSTVVCSQDTRVTLALLYNESLQIKA